MKPELEKLARHRLSRARDGFAEGEQILAASGLRGAVNPVPRLHSHGIGALPFGDKAHSSPPSQAGLPVIRGEGTVMHAIELVGRHRMPLWDALIAACMLEHGVHTIVTENERDFKRIPGITVINPFKKRSE